MGKGSLNLCMHSLNADLCFKVTSSKTPRIIMKPNIHFYYQNIKIIN